MPVLTVSPLNNLNHPVVETGSSVVEDVTGSDNMLSMIGHHWWGLHEYLTACLDESKNMQYPFDASGEKDSGVGGNFDVGRTDYGGNFQGHRCGHRDESPPAANLR